MSMAFMAGTCAPPARHRTIRNSNGFLFETTGEEAVPNRPRRTPRPRAASARELAAQAATKGRRHLEPAGGDITVTGASLAQWAPAQASFEVAQANPGLCAVLENAALRFANGQAADARKQLEEGIENDNDTKLSLLAWLALFDLLQRAARPRGVRPARAAVRHAVRALGAGVGRRRYAHRPRPASSAAPSPSPARSPRRPQRRSKACGAPSRARCTARGSISCR